MFISRFWVLLLAVAGAGVLSVVLLAKDQVNRERKENATAILYSELDKIEMTLTLHARKRLDALLSVTLDENIRKYMYSIYKDANKANDYRQKLLTLFRNRNGELGKYSADMLIAVDSRGKVIVQVGQKNRDHGYSLAGFPAVDAALRGYIRDDVWKLDNEVYFIATRPVIENRKYVGAVVHAVQITDKLASDISPTIQLGFFVGNMMLAVGTPKNESTVRAQGSFIGQPLDKVIADKQFVEKGYSEIQLIKTKETDFVAVYSKIKGEAAANDVGWAIVTPQVFLNSATDLYSQAGSQDIANLPILLIVLGAIIIIMLGWFWIFLEAERPLGKLYKSILDMEKADPKDQLNIYKFRRKIRKIAASFNKVADIKVKAVLDSVGDSGKSIESILGKSEDSRLSSASFKFAEASSDDIPAPPPAALVPPQVGAKAIPAKLPSDGGPPPSRNMNAKSLQASPKPSPKPSSKSSPKPPTSFANENDYFKNIYKEFIALKTQLGEPVTNLSFEKFEVNLKKNSDVLIARYGCKYVKFHVYEKDGKASMKAIPVQ